MTIQWTVIATFLYLELLFIFLLLLPFISPKIWQYIFQSRIFRVIAAKANMYFTIFVIVLILFFLDSVREMMKYSHKSTKDYEAELQLNMKLFRSQRNYYISGFTVFLWLVIRRLIVLILEEAELLDENETAMKRAQSATETFQKLQRKEENEVR
ncbi:B-cell receptor-associated protein 31, partial [Stegodyphus mimosarum]